MTTEQRLERLERQLAEMKAARVIRAGKLVLEDEKGEIRAALFMGDVGPALALFDDNGEIRARLTVTKDGPRLGLCDENGKVIWSAP